eukprot:6371976-Prymnesium_polylepis.1
MAAWSRAMSALRRSWRPLRRLSYVASIRFASDRSVLSLSSSESMRSCCRAACSETVSEVFSAAGYEYDALGACTAA